MLRFRPSALPVAALFLLPLLLQPTRVLAERAAALEGTATDAAGRPLPGAIVRVISDPATHASHPWRYTLVGNALGKFSQEGLAPGAYLVMLFPGGQASSILRRIELRAGAVQQLELHLPGTATAGFALTQAALAPLRRAPAYASTH